MGKCAEKSIMVSLILLISFLFVGTAHAAVLFDSLSAANDERNNASRFGTAMFEGQDYPSFNDVPDITIDNLTFNIKQSGGSGLISAWSGRIRVFTGTQYVQVATSTDVFFLENTDTEYKEVTVPFDSINIRDVISQNNENLTAPSDFASWIIVEVYRIHPTFGRTASFQTVVPDFLPSQQFVYSGGDGGLRDWAYIMEGSGSTTTPPHIGGNSNVLFLPGIKGSRLYKEGLLTEVKLWEPLSNNNVNDLFVDENGLPNDNSVYTRDVIDTIEITGRKIYNSFFQDLDNLIVWEVINEWSPYSYDWRLDPFDVVNVKGSPQEDGSNRDLIPLVRELASTARNGKVSIVAHSNGGLVGKALIHELELLGEEDLIDKFIMVGSPQTGTPSALGAALHGIDQGIGFNGINFILSEKVARQFAQNLPGAYTLFPYAEYFSDTTIPVVEFALGEETILFRDYYGPKIDSIKEYNEFLLGAEGRPIPADNDLLSPIKLSGTVFEKMQNSRSILDNWTPPENVQVIQLAGWGQQTIRTLRYTDKKKPISCEDTGGIVIEGICYETILDVEAVLTRSGDDTVVTPSAIAEEENRYYVNLFSQNLLYEENKGHATLFEVDDVRSFVTELISTTTMPSVDDYQFISEAIDTASLPFDLEFSAHSPLVFEIIDSQGRSVGRNSLPGSDNELIFYQTDIPNSSYTELGDGKYAIIPLEGAYSVHLKGTETGYVTLKTKVYKEDLVLESMDSEPFYVTASSTGTLSIDSGLISLIEIDINGDGSIDTLINMNGDLMYELLSDIKNTIKQTSLNRNTKQSFIDKTYEIRNLLKKEKYTQAQEILSDMLIGIENETVISVEEKEIISEKIKKLLFLIS